MNETVAVGTRWSDGESVRGVAVDPSAPLRNLKRWLMESQNLSIFLFFFAIDFVMIKI